MSSKSRPPRTRPSIKKDGIHPADFLAYKLPWACEDCVYFNTNTEACILEYPSWHHRRAEQLRCYELTGKMALCRFLEMD